MENEKLDIQIGDRITYRYLEIKDKIYIAIINMLSELIDYERMVKENQIEILKLERPKYEVIEEKKELLTKEERDFLKSYMKLIGFEKDIEYIIKRGNRFLYLILSDNSDFEIEVSSGENFNKLENDKEYTVKELGLEEN